MARRRNNNSTPKVVVVRAVEPEALSLAGFVNVSPRRDVKVHLAELDDQKRALVWNAVLNCVENGMIEVRLVDGKQPKKNLGKPRQLEHVAGEDKLTKSNPGVRETNLTGEGAKEGPVKPDTVKKDAEPEEEDAEEETSDEVADDTEEETNEAPPAPPAPPAFPPTPPAASDEDSDNSTPDL